MGKKISIKTKRLIISPKTAEELKLTIDQEQNPIMKQAYQEMLTGVEEHEKDWLWYTLWSVRLKNQKEIGGICFKGIANDCGEVEIGYGIDEEYQNQHYATEAVGQLINWAMSDQRVYYVMAETAPENQISMHLLEKLGFVPSGYSGEEGPVFEKEKDKSTFAMMYLGLGLSLGVCFGMTFIDNMAVGMCIGMAVGMLIGGGLDKKDQKKRQELYDKRKDKRQN